MVWKTVAGIGPINTSRADLLRRKGERQGIVSPKNELEIFCSLCVGSVYYQQHKRMLYFVDSPELSVSEIVSQVFRGLGEIPRIRQLYMDEHNLFSAARCIELTGAQRKALFAAFSISGIHFTNPTQ